MASFRSFSGSGPVTATTASQTVSEPLNAANGDALVGLVIAESGASPAIPAGWTPFFATVTQGGMKFQAGWIKRGSSAPSYTFTIQGGVTNFYREVYVMAIKPDAVGAYVDLDAIGTMGSTSSSSHQPNTPAVIAQAAASLAVDIVAHWGGIATTPSLTGYTVRSNGTSGEDGALATKTLSAAGSEDPPAWTGFSGATTDWWDGLAVTFTDKFASLITSGLRIGY